MDFYETRMGQEFYTNTVPRITKALEDIAKSLNAPAPVIQLPQDIPKDFLTDPSLLKVMLLVDICFWESYIKKLEVRIKLILLLPPPLHWTHFSRIALYNN